nr:aminoacyl tRNA synthase complex-interacting multifunctional protein 2-like [Cherax quadricarinatus]
MHAKQEEATWKYTCFEAKRIAVIYLRTKKCQNVSHDILKGNSKITQLFLCIHELTQFLFFQVCGEHNIGRYLSRLVEVATHSINLYECSSSSVFTAQIDELLDQCHSKFTLGNNRERTSYVRELSAKLDKESYLVGSSITLADLLVLSNLLQLRMLESAPSNVLKWSKGCLEHHLCKYFI